METPEEKQLDHNNSGNPDNKEQPKPAEVDDIDKVMDSWKKWRDELPENRTRYIMIVGFSILFILVVLLGVAYGGMKVCSDLDGVLDNKFKCHPDYYANQTIIVNMVPQFIVAQNNSQHNIVETFI